MTASEQEIKTIMRILREMWTELAIETVIEEVWESVGKDSDNESFKETIRLMFRDISSHFMIRDKLDEKN